MNSGREPLWRPAVPIWAAMLMAACAIRPPVRPMPLAWSLTTCPCSSGVWTANDSTSATSTRPARGVSRLHGQVIKAKRRNACPAQSTRAYHKNVFTPLLVWVRLPKAQWPASHSPSRIWPATILLAGRDFPDEGSRRWLTSSLLAPPARRRNVLTVSCPFVADVLWPT
jgi:hypothetical protein